MNSTPKLNFPPINLRAKRDNGRTLVFDNVRSMYVVLTPEEWVRRHLVEFLIEGCGAPLRSIVEEYPVNINSTPQRADVVVMDSSATPLLLAECKAPEINFEDKKVVSEVFAQASRYNAVVGARYIVLTNGLKHFCFEQSQSKYTPLASFPKLG
ncbi:MAG: type I restriction enzyme HsdR N-terminal domain-containing protein [Alistipes sp.]|nr:type I restriction enzyme HsdR N-terminal domain-containing protein [Alistipes sp.]